MWPSARSQYLVAAAVDRNSSFLTPSSVFHPTHCVEFHPWQCHGLWPCFQIYGSGTHTRANFRLWLRLSSVPISCAHLCQSSFNWVLPFWHIPSRRTVRPSCLGDMISGQIRKPLSLLISFLKPSMESLSLLWFIIPTIRAMHLGQTLLVQMPPKAEGVETGQGGICQCR